MYYNVLLFFYINFIHLLWFLSILIQVLKRRSSILFMLVIWISFAFLYLYLFKLFSIKTSFELLVGAVNRDNCIRAILYRVFKSKSLGSVRCAWAAIIYNYLIVSVRVVTPHFPLGLYIITVIPSDCTFVC